MAKKKLKNSFKNISELIELQKDLSYISDFEKQIADRLLARKINKEDMYYTYANIRILDTRVKAAVNYFNEIKYRGRNNWELVENKIYSFPFRKFVGGKKASSYLPIEYWFWEAVAIAEILQKEGFENQSKIK